MVLPEGTDLSKTYLLFSVKDQSPVLGEGLLLGEALLPLADIVKEDGDVSLKVSLWTHTIGASAGLCIGCICTPPNFSMGPNGYYIPIKFLF